MTTEPNLTSTPANMLAFYCHQHQLRFRVMAGEVITCEQNGHRIGSGFPHQSSWQYCCDCATFSALQSETQLQQTQCVVCERQTARRYACLVCQVVSIESAATVARKQYSINATQGVSPDCPGCAARSEQKPTRHKCPRVGGTVFTLRATCPFCEAEIAENRSQKTEALIACQHCGTLVKRDIKFCGKCGKPPAQTHASDGKAVAATKVGSGKSRQPIAFVAPPPLLPELPDQTTPQLNASSWHVDLPLVPPGRAVKWKPVVIAVGATVLVVVTFAIAFGPRREKATPGPSLPTVPAGMIYVAAGEFTMGNDLGDDYEKPAHRVAVKAFFLDQTEVACREYEKFVKATNRKPPAGWINGSCAAGTADFPVTNVDWNDASAFAQWAGKRLPTEEEWEFAARGSDGRIYPWGNEWRANAANAGDSSAGHFTNVGSYPAGKSPFGAMDMSGNAWEWTASDLKPYPGSQLTKLPSGDRKIFRGGSWSKDSPPDWTVTFRGFALPSGGRDYSKVGFRCAKDAPTIALAK